jgi:hypothetical protein
VVAQNLITPFIARQTCTARDKSDHRARDLFVTRETGLSRDGSVCRAAIGFIAELSREIVKITFLASKLERPCPLSRRAKGNTGSFQDKPVFPMKNRVEHVKSRA